MRILLHDDSLFFERHSAQNHAHLGKTMSSKNASVINTQNSLSGVLHKNQDFLYRKTLKLFCLKLDFNNFLQPFHLVNIYFCEESKKGLFFY